MLFFVYFKRLESIRNTCKLFESLRGQFRVCQQQSDVLEEVREASPCDVCDVTLWGKGPSSLSYTGRHPRGLCSTHKQGIAIWEGRDRGISVGWRTPQL